MNLIKKLVKKNLSLNKKRTTVTIIGIILSVALLSALSTMVVSFQKSLVAYQKVKSGDFHVAYYNVEQDDLKTFDNNRGIDSYFTLSTLGYAQIDESKNEYKPYCRIISTNQDGFERGSFKLIEGRYPKNEKEIVIPHHLKTNGRVDLKVGEKITLNLGERLDKKTNKEISPYTAYTKDMESIENTKEVTYTIVGIVERPAFSIESYECPAYTFITKGEKSEGKLDVYSRFTRQGMKNSHDIIAGIIGVNKYLYKKVEAGDYEQLTDKDFEAYARQMDHAKYEIFVNSWLISYERVWPIDDTFLAIFSLAAVVVVIIIVTSVYCIKNSFEISMAEKIRQYGMLSSIGATKRQIKKSVHLEAALLGAIGIPVGTVSGLFAAFLLLKVSNYLLDGVVDFTLAFSASPVAILAAVLLGIVTIYLSAAGSARKASKVSPMEAIRNQKEIKLTAKSIRTPKYISKIWGIGGVISYKNIKRNKKKYRTTVVSIVICTVTFIVISYFMTMAMDLVSFNYTDSKYNLDLDIHFPEGYQLEDSGITSLDNIEEYTRSSYLYADVKDYTFTDEVKEYWDDIGMREDEMTIAILTLDEDAFKRYEKECGIRDKSNQIILVNNQQIDWRGEEKEFIGIFETFLIEKGDEMKIEITDYSNALYDDEGNIIDESVKRDSKTIKITEIADERPIGYKSSLQTNYLVMNEETAKKYEIPMDNHYSYFFISTDSDSLQDDLYDVIDNTYTDNTGYSIYNRDKNQRDEKSLFLLLDIFAYGLIVVIALIGITNIINTLNTSMELRSREFATLRSIGMTDAQFKRMVKLESFFTSAKALVAGVTIGMIISYIINKIECNYDTVIPFKPPVIPALIATAVVFFLIYIIISSSMKKINNRNIIDTIKNENL